MSVLRIVGIGQLGHLIPGTIANTSEGGLVILVHKLPVSITRRGLVCRASTNIPLSWEISQASERSMLGVIYEDDENPDLTWVVISGIAQVLLQDGTAAAPGNWVKTSDSQPGRANATTVTPPDGTMPKISERLRELGYCLESKTAGIDVLCSCLVSAH